MKFFKSLSCFIDNLMTVEGISKQLTTLLTR